MSIAAVTAAVVAWSEARARDRANPQVVFDPETGQVSSLAELAHQNPPALGIGGAKAGLFGVGLGYAGVIKPAPKKRSFQSVPWSSIAEQRPVFKDPRVAVVYDMLGGQVLSVNRLRLAEKIVAELDASALTEAFELAPGITA